MTGSIITIDGGAGSGKSTAAKNLADKLGVPYLDTGAMYRAVAWFALEQNADLQDEAQVASLLDGLELDLSDGQVHLSSPRLSEAPGNRRDVTGLIRTTEVSETASLVSQLLAVREFLTEQQLVWAAAQTQGVAEGRDMGTVVFPQAQHKFFLIASAEVRAKRRADELGSTDEIELTNIKQRDDQDRNRQHAPLRKADDAIEIDTTKLTPDEVVDTMLHHINPTNPTTEPTQPPRTESPRPQPPELYNYPAAKRYGQKRTVASVLTYWICRNICLLLGAVYFRFKVKNRHHLPKSGPVIIAPGGHRSNLDTPFVGMAVTRQPTYMAKDSLFKSPFWASFITLYGGFPVSRDKLDRRALKSAQDVLGRGEALIVFPEGARQQGIKLQPLFEGVAWLSAKTQAPVLPLGIGGTERVLPIGVKWPRPTKVRMVFGELIPPPGAKSQSSNQINSGRKRATRQELEDFTSHLSDQLQALFDEAQEWAGTPHDHSAES